MTLGLSLEAFTLLHVAISLIGIASGLVVLYGFIRNRRFNALTHVFFATTALTSVTGFMFPFHQVTPGIILGAISIVVLLPTVLAFYFFHLTGAWRWIFVVGAVAAEYFNVFVLVVQSFQKIPALNALAPKQNEPPFAVAQLIVLIIFLAAGVMAVKRFRPELTKARTAGAL